MLPRSLLLANHLRQNACKSFSSPFFIFQVGLSKRKFNILVCNPKKVCDTSRLRLINGWLSYSNTSDNGSKIAPDLDKNEGLPPSSVVSSNDNISEVGKFNVDNEVSVVKELEVKSNGKKLIVEAKIGPDSTITSLTFTKGPAPSAVAEVPAPTPEPVKRVRVDLTASSLERNFITPVRAMSDFLLKPSHLELLPKTKRRSPYELEPPITVYWRRDVEAKATEIWGSRENLKKELLRKEIDRRRYQQNVFTVKRRLRDYRREMGNSAVNPQEAEAGLKGRSGRVVLIAVGINMSNFLFKLIAWAYTGSHSMFSECIHSLADTINQLILAYGIHKSGQIADPNHPYGYTNMRYVASLISGVGIFCVGTGLAYYHGVTGLMNPQPMESFYWAYYILGGAIVSEGATLLVAINAIKKGAKEAELPFKDYVLRGSDPSVNVVLLEDTAAVAGVAVAGCFMGLSSLTGNPQWDACGSLFVGTILGGVASFIILTNVGALVGRSIPQEHLDKINSDLESDVMIRAIHDVKGIDMGSNLVRYKAELDFDGRELTRAYLDKQDINKLLEEAKKVNTIDELERFLLKHGENIVDMMGGEIDRIELKLRTRFPFLRHCDLEIL